MLAYAYVCAASCVLALCSVLGVGVTVPYRTDSCVHATLLTTVCYTLRELHATYLKAQSSHTRTCQSHERTHPHIA